MNDEIITDETLIKLKLAELRNQQYLSIIGLCLDLIFDLDKHINQHIGQETRYKIDFGLQETGTGWRLL